MFLTSSKNLSKGSTVSRITSNKINSLYIFETLVGEVVAGFTPLDLFQNGEQGVWYDPSDLTTLFQDSVGTTPVTADGDPVGLMLDKSQGLEIGSELVTNGTFDTDSDWILGTGWTISGGQAVGVSVPNAVVLRQLNTLTEFEDGKHYSVTYTISGMTEGGIRLQNPATGQARSVDGTYTERVISVSANDGFRLRAVGVTTCNIDNISVKELKGNHATQSVSVSRPTYRTDGTLHWLEFDGVDDYMQGVFGGSEPQPNTVIFSGYSNNNGTSYFFDGIEEGSRHAKLIRSSSSVTMLSGGESADSYSGVTPTTNAVSFSRFDGSNSWARTNGIVEVDTISAGTESVSGVTIGARLSGTAALNGSISGFIFVNRITTDDEVDEIESYLSEKSGVTLP
jgi:hypothetical protein